MQVRSSVRLTPQNQPSGRGLLPSPTAWSPDQHLAAMLADVFRHILGRTEGRGLGFGQLVHTHTGKCLKCQISKQTQRTAMRTVWKWIVGSCPRRTCGCTLSLPALLPSGLSRFVPCPRDSACRVRLQRYINRLSNCVFHWHEDDDNDNDDDDDVDDNYS